MLFPRDSLPASQRKVEKNQNSWKIKHVLMEVRKKYWIETFFFGAVISWKFESAYAAMSLIAALTLSRVSLPLMYLQSAIALELVGSFIIWMLDGTLHSQHFPANLCYETSYTSLGFSICAKVLRPRLCHASNSVET